MCTLALGEPVGGLERSHVEEDTQAADRQAHGSGGVGLERLQAILDTIPQMVWSTRPDGHHDFYNQRWYEFTGTPLGSTDGEGWNAMFHPDDQQRAWSAWRSSLATGQPYEIEYRLRHHTGEYRWTLGRAMPIRSDDGQIVRWFGTCTDVDDLKNAEEARELIARELAHRIKNIFMVVTSLITLSVKAHPEAQRFADTLTQRIGALARANEFVGIGGTPQGPSDDGRLLSLIRRLTAPYQDKDESRIVIAGDDTRIGVQAATAIALVLHELATNAVKYGALTAERGQIAIECARHGDRFSICWREEGGPAVAGPPAHRGFGTEMSRRLAASQLHATIEEEWLPARLSLKMDLSAALLGR